MDTDRPKQKTSASFEYFLYAAIIVETALAAFVYKIIFRDPDLARLNLYFGIFYFAFLAWSIVQLNKVHRRRKLAEDEPAEPSGEPMSDQAPAEDIQGNQRGKPAAVPKHSRSALGLTTAQLVIVIVIFITAVATFSWALRLLR
jgi:hypothetical protein